LFVLITILSLVNPLSHSTESLLNKVASIIINQAQKSAIIMILCLIILWTEDPSSSQRKSSAEKPSRYKKMANDSFLALDRWVGSWQTKRRRRRSGMSGRRQFRSVISMAVLAMNGTTSISITECGPFDSDSALVGIDNRCSGCTHVRTDIPGEITPCNKIIKGFGGSRTANVWTGTIHWNWDDDQGITHKMVIPNSY
jgi:hypothetical protein